MTRDESLVVAEYSREPATPVTLAIVRGIAAVEGANPTHLEFTLYDYVDPEALETLLRAEPPNSITVRVAVTGYEVVLRNDGTIRILEPP